MIVYAWVNDEDTKSAYVSSDDPYRVFRRMLESGRPPDDWDQLLAEAQKESRRMQESLARVTVSKRSGVSNLPIPCHNPTYQNNRSFAWLNHLIGNSKSTSSKAHKTLRV